MIRKNMYTAILALLAINMTYGQMAQDRLYYIEKYSKIAQDEMERTGVPASIKLAQAILESNGGKSVLSRKANNHFGIKCGGDWNDRTFYRVDDEKDKKGNDIESCFRMYKNPESSFIAHSEFLRNNQRYGFLFELAHDDYKGWAHGLKKAGYATNPKYPSLLIKIVEDYSLFKYDDLFRPYPDDDMLASTEEDAFFEELARQEKKQKVQKVIKLGKVNDVDIVVTEADETPEIVAAKTDVSLKRILKYNDALTDPSEVIPTNTKVYLQPKRSSYRGRKKFHKVREGETMAHISQQYGIRLDKLISRNRLSADEEPMPGAILKIKGRKVAANSRIATNRVSTAGNSSKESKKTKHKFSTALSDFELPPSIAEEKRNNERREQRSPTHTQKEMPTPNRRVEQSRTSTSSYLEDSKEATSVYSAPAQSENYNTDAASSNVKFKPEGNTTTTEIVTRPGINHNTRISTDKASTYPAKETTTVESPKTNTQYTNSTSPTSNATTSTATERTTNTYGSTTTIATTTNTSTYAPTISTPPTQQVATRYHTVEKGQTLYRLSKMYGKSVDYIKQANGLSSNTISIGQKLVVN